MIVAFKPNKTGMAVIGVILIAVFAIVYRKRKNLKKVMSEAVNWIQQKTWDIHTNRRINTLHPKIQAKAKEFIIKAEKQLGIKLRVTSALRTWNEQQKLYNQGRSSSGKIVTHAKPGQSYHNYGLAFDVVEIKGNKALWKNPNWVKIGQLGESLGFTWGGRWSGKKNDKPHFELTFGKNWRELSELYKAGKRNGEYVNLA